MCAYRNGSVALLRRKSDRTVDLSSTITIIESNETHKLSIFCAACINRRELGKSFLSRFLSWLGCYTPHSRTAPLCEHNISIFFHLPWYVVCARRYIAKTLLTSTHQRIDLVANLFFESATICYHSSWKWPFIYGHRQYWREDFPNVCRRRVMAPLSQHCAFSMGEFFHAAETFNGAIFETFNGACAYMRSLKWAKLKQKSPSKRNNKNVKVPSVNHKCRDRQYESKIKHNVYFLRQLAVRACVLRQLCMHFNRFDQIVSSD